MKGPAIRITGPERYEIVEIECPEPGPGEVAIEVAATGVCNQHDDWVLANGWRGRPYPLEAGFPGHEGAGIVSRSRAGAGGPPEGTVVALSAIGGPPLYRRFVLRRAADVVALPPGTPPGHAALLELYACVLRALSKTDVRGRRVGVVGLGPAGLCCVQLLKVLGASEIIGFEKCPARLLHAAASERGPDRIVDSSVFEGAFEAATRAARDGTAALSAAERRALEAVEAESVDLAIECTGDPASSSTSSLLARRELVFFGFSRQNFAVCQMPWFEKELTIRNSKRLETADLRRAAELLSCGLLDPSAAITHALPFGEYGRAVGLIRRKEAVKVVLRWDRADAGNG
ncbi:MAG: zinc-binding dehydrogenase [Planctomycetota bacterium]|nr:zinc-binding dehydrogenase [Planctomycetota bacterium]